MEREEMLNTIINSTYYKENPNLRIYIDDVKSYKEESNEKIKDLAIKAQRGDKTELEKIFSHYQMAVLQYAFENVNEDVDIMDLIQAGNEGIYKAVEFYKYNLKSCFSTIVINYIKREIKKETYNQQFIQKHGFEIPDGYQAASEAYNKAKKILGYEPSKEEVLSLTNANKLSTNKYYSLPIIDIELDKGFSKEQYEELKELSCLLQEFKEPDSDIDKKMIINALLDRLRKRRRQIVEMYFGLNGEEPKKIQEIADYYGVSKQNISAAINESLKKMKKIMIETNGNINLIKENPKKEKHKNKYIPQDEGKSFYQIFEQYDVETNDIIKVLSTLEKKYMKILEKKFGKDLNGEASNRLTKEEDNTFYNVILTIILFRACTIKEQRLEQEKQEYLKYMNIINDEKLELAYFLSSEDFKNQIKYLDVAKVFITKLKFGAINGEEYSEENIAYFLKFSKSYIYECIKEIVTLCNNLNNNKFRNYLAYYENEKEIAKEKGIKL